MRPNLPIIVALSLSPLAMLSTLSGCEKKEPAPAPAKADDHGHDHAEGEKHDGHDHEPADGHSGTVIKLGEQTIGSFTAAASRDSGEIVAGKDAPIDVTVTPVAGATSKVAAVRFWIGTQDAKGSVKAKAEIEDPKEPNRWHVHAEIPNPIPADSKLWVEIEDEKGVTAVGGFALNN